MPQVVIEHGIGKNRDVDFQPICNDVFKVLAAHDAFPDPSAIKVRASAVDAFCVGSEPRTFAHATLWLLPGREIETRKHLNQLILDVLINALPEVGSLTVQDVEIVGATYVKRLL